MREKSKSELKRILNVSDSIASSNHKWFQEFHLEHDTNIMHEMKQAVFLYDGPAFRGLDYRSLSVEGKERAIRGLRILSGLYGILCANDLIQPYRLEMSNKYGINGHKSIYEYWGTRLTCRLNEELSGSSTSSTVKLLINLASEEYAKAINLSELDPSIQVIQCVFKDKNKVVSVHVKRARGLMARYIFEEQIDQTIDYLDRLKYFDYEGYAYEPSQSTATMFVYNRDSVMHGKASKKLINVAKRALIEVTENAEVTFTDITNTEDGNKLKSTSHDRTNGKRVRRK